MKVYESVWIDVKSSLRSMSRRGEEKIVTPRLLKQVFLSALDLVIRFVASAWRIVARLRLI